MVRGTGVSAASWVARIVCVSAIMVALCTRAAGMEGGRREEARNGARGCVVGEASRTDGVGRGGLRGALRGRTRSEVGRGAPSPLRGCGVCAAFPRAAPGASDSAPFGGWAGGAWVVIAFPRAAPGASDSAPFGGCAGGALVVIAFPGLRPGHVRVPLRGLCWRGLGCRLSRAAPGAGESVPFGGGAGGALSLPFWGCARGATRRYRAPP